MTEDRFEIPPAYSAVDRYAQQFGLIDEPPQEVKIRSRRRSRYWPIWSLYWLCRNLRFLSQAEAAHLKTIFLSWHDLKPDPCA